MTPPPIFFFNVGNNIKREENMKYWKRNSFNFFLNIKKNHNKFKHAINIKKNYTAHHHVMVHVPAKFRENTTIRFRVTVRKLNVTDGWTGSVAIISRPRAYARREITRGKITPIFGYSDPGPFNIQTISIYI